jgi:hypothetical protein
MFNRHNKRKETSQMSSAKKAARKRATKKDILGSANPAPQSAAAAEHAATGEHRRPQVQELGLKGEGVAKPEVPALDEAVREYVSYRDKRLAAGVEEKRLKKQVIALMHGHKLVTYEVDDMVVISKPKDETESIKVMAKADYTGESSED